MVIFMGVVGARSVLRYVSSENQVSGADGMCT